MSLRSYFQTICLSGFQILYKVMTRSSGHLFSHRHTFAINIVSILSQPCEPSQTHGLRIHTIILCYLIHMLHVCKCAYSQNNLLC